MKNYHRIIIIIIFSFISCKKENDSYKNYLLIYKGTDREYDFGKEGVFFTYDKQNRLIKKEDKDENYGGCYYVIEEFAYNDIGLIIKITETHGNCNSGDLTKTESVFEYGSLGKLIQKNNNYRDHRGSTFWNSDQTIKYNYNENGQVFEVISFKQYIDIENSRSESLIDSIVYNANNQIIETVSRYIKMTSSGTEEGHIEKAEYYYDENGNVIKITEYYNDNFSMEKIYQYDENINPLYNISALNRQDNFLEHLSKNNIVYRHQNDNQTTSTIIYSYSYNSNEYPETVKSSIYLVDLADPSNNDDRKLSTEEYKYEIY